MLRKPRPNDDDPVYPFFKAIGIAIWVFLLGVAVLESLYLYNLFMWRIGL